MVRRVLSGLLILVVLVGTVGVNYDAHYCGGEFVKSEISILPQTLSCGMKHERIENGNDETPSFKRLCCSSERSNFQLDDDYVKYESQAIALIGDFSFPEAVFTVEAFIEETKYEFLGYSPPPVYEDIVILYQSFLI